MMRGTTEEWLNAEIDNLQGGMEELALAKPFESSDFWMPEVTSDGQICYVNSKTGQRARDLPNECDGNMEVALGLKDHVPGEPFNSMKYQSSETSTLNDDHPSTNDDTIVSPGSTDDLVSRSPTLNENSASKSKSSGNIIVCRFPTSISPQPKSPSQPWYLQPTYSPTELIIDPGGAVRAGTVPALVERVTAHEQADPTFVKSFLMTFKSFTTVDELFDLLLRRFWIQPPPKLTQAEHEEWVNLKQRVVQIRVLNIFKAMIGNDVLEKDDLFILDRMKEFIATEEVARFPAAKLLLILIERTQKGGDSMIEKVGVPQGAPPSPLVPKSSKTLKLLDIEPLELARQLTIMESQLYQRITPMDCLWQARKQTTENIDNITVVIQTNNKIADWVAESVLSEEDSWGRAQIVKHLISVADHCRRLANFSTMTCIKSGLNSPPIRRLKRTWDQVNHKSMVQFSACEEIVSPSRGFVKYRHMIACAVPPCIPFLGIPIVNSQFVQDRYRDNLPATEGGSTLVDFRKRQKLVEVINEIKRWQVPFNLHVVPSIQAYIEHSLNSVSDIKECNERFWTISLELEPRDAQDGKMARLLKESGFL
ncbi:ras guanine nucleotide exchange factor domain-containing protein [Mycena leptocephala]|nr:ras guanine nucleotide exchange factor domain-containing protein [Mycena leptocephala]